VRLQLHALPYNLANFLRTLTLPEEIKHWSLTTLRQRLAKIGAKIVRHRRCVIFQMAEVAVPRDMFQKSLPLSPLCVHYLRRERLLPSNRNIEGPYEILLYNLASPSSGILDQRVACRGQIFSRCREAAFLI
jgi:hypothetical protein